MGELIKLCLFAMVAIVIALQFRGVRQEYSTLIGIVLGIVIFCYVLSEVVNVVHRFGELGQILGEGKGFMAILVKILGITYICEFGANICKEAGFLTAAAQIEVLGKLSVLFAGTPILMAVIEELSQMWS